MSTREKVTDLNEIDVVSNGDVVHIVKVSDNVQDPAGSSFKTTIQKIKDFILQGISLSSPGETINISETLELDINLNKSNHWIAEQQFDRIINKNGNVTLDEYGQIYCDIGTVAIGVNGDFHGDGLALTNTLHPFDLIDGRNITIDWSNPDRPVFNSSADRYKTTSADTHTIASTGTKTFNVDINLAYTPGQDVLISYDVNNYMHGTVVSYSASTLVVSITDKQGSGSYSTWLINLDAIAVQTASPDALYYKGVWNGLYLGHYPGGGLAQKGWVYYCIIACTISDDYLSQKVWNGNSLMVANKDNADPYNNNDWDVLIDASKVSYGSVAVSRNASNYVSGISKNDPQSSGARSYTINRTGTKTSSIDTPNGRINITRDANGYYQSSNAL